MLFESGVFFCGVEEAAETLTRSHPDTLVRKVFLATDWFPFSNGALLCLPLNSWLWKSLKLLIAVTLCNANRKRTLWGQRRKGRTKYPGGTITLSLSLSPSMFMFAVISTMCDTLDSSTVKIELPEACICCTAKDCSCTAWCSQLNTFKMGSMNSCCSVLQVWGEETMGNQKQHGLHVTNERKGERLCCF